MPAPTFRVIKADTAQQIVYGWASVAVTVNGEPVEDLQDDVIAPEDLEQTSIDFMLTSRESGVMHEGKAVGQVIASLVTTPEIVKAFFGDDVTVQTGWILGVKLADPDTFRQVQEGKLAMLSIQGTADREEIQG